MNRESICYIINMRWRKHVSKQLSTTARPGRIHCALEVQSPMWPRGSIFKQRDGSHIMITQTMYDEHNCHRDHAMTETSR